MKPYSTAIETIAYYTASGGMAFFAVSALIMGVRILTDYGYPLSLGILFAASNLFLWLTYAPLRFHPPTTPKE